MPRTALTTVLENLRRVWAAQEARGLSDAELLARWLADPKDAAFAVLVQRHGPMVLSVCQRILGDLHVAEDCFQATFMVLMRRAASISRKVPLAGWLHGVARRIALRARQQTQARRQREGRVDTMQSPDRLDELTWQELRGVLDEEVGRLAEKYRVPIILCYFEGKSHGQAAKELGCPKNTITSRLAHGRETAPQAIGAAGYHAVGRRLATALCEKAGAAPVSAVLTINTVKAATSMAAGKAAAGGGISAAAIAMAEELLKSMLYVKATVILMVLAVGVAVGGAGLAGLVGPAGANPDANVVDPAAMVFQSPAQPPKTTPPKLEPRLDFFGDPLPDGAAARLGTARFRHGQTTMVSYSPDGTKLASTGRDGFGVCLWDAATGRALHRLSLPAFCWSLVFSPDGKMLVAVNAQGELSLIDVALGKELRRFGPPDGFNSAAFTPGGLTLAARHLVQGGSRVVFLDVATGKEQRGIEWKHDGLPDRGVDQIAFSPDGKILASASPDNIVRLWDVATGKQLPSLGGHEKAVWFVVFSKDGKILATAGDSGAIRLWDVATGKLLRTCREDQGMVESLALSPDGKVLASASGDAGGIVRLWDIETGKELLSRKAYVWWVTFSPDGKTLACIARDSTIHLLDAGTLKEIGPITGHTSYVSRLKFTADGKALFSAGGNRAILEWDMTALGQQRTLFTDVDGPTQMQHGWQAVDVSPNGKVVALVPYTQPAIKVEDDAVHLFESGTGKELFVLRGNKEEPKSVVFSSNGNLLASTGKDGIRLWDVATGKQLHWLQEQLSAFVAVAFSHDDNVLGFATADGTIQLRESGTAKEIRRWSTEQKSITALAFSSDGKMVVALAGKEAQVWDAESGKRVLTFGGLDGLFNSVGFSPSGRILAIGGFHKINPTEVEGRTAKVILLETWSGQELRRIDLPQGTKCSLAVAPDGRTLATGGYDSTILLWDLTGQSTVSKKESAPPTAKELEALWSDLAGDALKADSAIWVLVLSPKQSMPLLKDRLRPPSPAAADKVAKLVADLDGDRFAIRQQATAALIELGAAAEAQLRKTLQSNPTLEVRQRVEQILEKRKPDTLRNLRAIEILEQIGTGDARELLGIMAKESASPRVAQGAAAALNRVVKRQP